MTTQELSPRILSSALLRSFQAIAGGRNVMHQPVDLALYSYDAAIDRARPSCVVFPTTAAQVAAIVKLCRKNNLPFVARGAGTNLCGGTIPLQGAVVIAPTQMKRLLSVDPDRRIAVVEPGMPNLFLKKALEPYGLHYAPDPASQKACTIGGNIGTNAGGPHCLKYGVTSQHVLGIEAVLPDGEVAQLNVEDEGPDFTGFFVGSEGTLGIATRATLNLVPIPKFVETMLVSFPSLEAAIQTVTDIISSGIIPATLEAMDKLTVQAVEGFIHAGYPTDAEAILLIEVDGDSDLKGQVEAIRAHCARNHSMEFRLARDAREREKLWEGRRGSYPSLARLAPNVLVEDGAVPRNKLPEALKRIREIAQKYGVNVSLIFHAGDGNLHPQILFDERDEEQTRTVKAAGYQILKACVDLGGSISGEHGIGIDKREAMRWLFTPETLQFFRRVKNAFDPENLCNPEKLIPAVEFSPLPERSTSDDTSSLAAIGRDGHFLPTDSAELRVILNAAVKERKTVSIRGASEHAPASPADWTVSTARLNKVMEHDVENFTVTVEAGMKIADLQKELAAKAQKVLMDSKGSLGGAIGAGAGQFPRLRDQILGMTVLLADGSVAKLGGKVMKNVAGYDAAKLFLGARGSLGAILSVTLRTFPVQYDASFEACPVSKRPIPETSRAIYRNIKRQLDPENIFAEPEFLKPPAARA